MLQEIAGKVYKTIHDAGLVGSVVVSAMSEDVHNADTRPISIIVDCKNRDTGDETHFRFSVSTVTNHVTTSDNNLSSTLDAIIVQSDCGVLSNDVFRTAQWIDKNITEILSYPEEIGFKVEKAVNDAGFNLGRIYISDLDCEDNLDSDVDELSVNLEYVVSTATGDVITILYDNQSLDEKTGSMNLDKVSSDRLGWMLSTAKIDRELQGKIITDYSSSVFESVSTLSNTWFIPYIMKSVYPYRHLHGNDNKAIANVLKEAESNQDDLDITNVLRAKADKATEQMMGDK